MRRTTILLVVEAFLSLFIVPSHSFLIQSSFSRQQLIRRDEKVSEDDEISLEAFQRAKEKITKAEEFDGYKLRDVIVDKWGYSYDVDFNRVDSFGFKKVYLNILPFRPGKRPFRHASEYDYLCHLQAVVEILQQYDQLDYVLYQIAETKKKPRPGTSPLVAVPIRLDLSPEQVKEILG